MCSHALRARAHTSTNLRLWHPVLAAGGKSTFTLADTRQPAKQGDYARTHMPAHPDFEVDVPESEA